MEEQLVIARKPALDDDRVSDEHAVGVKDAAAIEPDVDDGGEAVEAEPDRLADTCGREPTAVPPVVAVEILRTIDIPSSRCAQGCRHRQRSITLDP